MRTELPIMKRCCFCLPLRYGLIVWGYLKMVPLLLYFYLLIVDLHEMTQRGFTSRGSYPILVVISILILSEIIFNIILLIAAHKKNYKLFRIYYLYIVGELIVMTLLLLIETGNRIYWMARAWYFFSHGTWLFTIQMFAVEIAFIGICIYITLLVRSELKKLENENASCNFVNLDAEARCEIVSDEPKRADATRVDLTNTLDILKEVELH